MAKKQRTDLPLPGDYRDIGAEVTISGPDARVAAATAIEFARELYAATVAYHKFAFETMQILLRMSASGTVTGTELTDVALALSKSAELVDDTRKELDAVRKKEINKQICKEWFSDPNAPERYQGDFASGFPRVVTKTTVPKFEDDPEGYNYLCDFLGIAEDMRDRGKILCQEGEFKTQVVKVDWEGFQDYVNLMLLAGHQLPQEVIDRCKMKQWQEFDVALRKKRDLLSKVSSSEPE